MKKLYHVSQENHKTHLYQTMQQGDCKFLKLNPTIFSWQNKPPLHQVKCVPENNWLVFL